MRQYTLMNKNKETLDFELDVDTAQIYKIVKYKELDYLPLSIRVKDGVPQRKDLVDWWEGRAIPASRSGLRDALDTIGIKYSRELLVKSLGLSLSDQYWIKESGSEATWDNVNFFNNDFSDDMGKILFGERLKAADLNSPCNTSDGWLKKKWKIVDGKRALLKAGSGTELQEPINELLVTVINKRLGYNNFVPYYLVWENEKPLSLCYNFITEDTELISALSVINTSKKSNNTSDYQHYLNCCEELGISRETTEEFMSYMLTLDYLILNQDRHYNNFGLIRDVNSLKIIGHAPIFDSGTSLWNGVATSFISNQQEESKPFRKTHPEQIKLIKESKWFDKDKLYGIEDEFNEIMKQSPYIEDNRRSVICNVFRSRLNKFFNGSTKS